MSRGWTEADLGQHVTPSKRSKYNARQKVVDNVTFQSSAEARRYIELKAMQAAGQIANLTLQPRFLLLAAFTDGTGKKHRAMEYVGDFFFTRDGQLVCEDCKGLPTPVFRVKWKLAIQKHPHVRFELSR